MICPIIKLAKQLIRCPSISPNDKGCQEIIIEHLYSIGFTIEKLNFGDTQNLWAWRGTGKTLVFAGHTDVVPSGNQKFWNTPPFKPTIHNGMLYGRGAADMKGSLAAMIVAAERFVFYNKDYKNRLAFIITSDEESHAINGTVKVIETLKMRNEQLDYCIVGEPSSTKYIGDVIKNGRRGSITANVCIYGIQGHVAYPDLIDNPIHRIIPILNELILIKWDYGNKYFPPTSMQIVNIQSGIGVNNITPNELLVQFNFRFSSEITDVFIKDRIESLLQYKKINYTIKWYLSGQPFITKCGILINTVIDTVEHYSKLTPQLSTSGGTSDGRFISTICSQVLELGPVNSTIHKINECVSISDLQILSLMYERIMKKLIL